jgi:hypothetical protein
MTTPTVDQAVSPLLDAREILAAALVADTGYHAYPSFTAAVATPCYVLQGNGWQVSTSGRVIYKVLVTCLYSNQAGELHGGVEELARLAVVACADAGFGVFDVPAPGTVTLSESREYAGVQFEAQVPVTLRSI